MPGFGAHICDVSVDKETGHVTIERYTAIQDVGKAIHPSYVEGQIQGGAAQGIGWALNEEYIYNAKGQMENAGFLDYRVPVASDVPMIEAVLVEVPNPRHPFGARGVGEVPIVPPMAAIANAIRSATGLRMAGPADVAAEGAGGVRRGRLMPVVVLSSGSAGQSVDRRPDGIRGGGDEFPPPGAGAGAAVSRPWASRSRRAWRSPSTARSSRTPMRRN